MNRVSAPGAFSFRDEAWAVACGRRCGRGPGQGRCPGLGGIPQLWRRPSPFLVGPRAESFSLFSRAVHGSIVLECGYTRNDSPLCGRTQLHEVRACLESLEHTVTIITHLLDSKVDSRGDINTSERINTFTILDASCRFLSRGLAVCLL